MGFIANMRNAFGFAMTGAQLAATAAIGDDDREAESPWADGSGLATHMLEDLYGLAKGITITDERAQEIDFTDPYVDSNQSLVVLGTSSDTSTTLNVAGKKIACQSGTTGNDWIKENMPLATCVPLDDVAAAMAGVETGHYYGFVIDLPVSSNLIAQSFTDLKVAEEIPTGEQYGIAVSKDNPGLTEAINDALAKMKSDGTMDSIETTWFGSTI